MEFNFYYSVFTKEGSLKRYLYVTFTSAESKVENKSSVFTHVKKEAGNDINICKINTENPIRLNSIEEAKNLRAAIAFAMMANDTSLYLENNRNFAEYGKDSKFGVTRLPDIKSFAGRWDYNQIEYRIHDSAGLLEKNKHNIESGIKDCFKTYMLAKYGSKEYMTKKTDWWKKAMVSILKTCDVPNVQKIEIELGFVEKPAFVMTSANDVRAKTKEVNEKKHQAELAKLEGIMELIMNAAENGKFEVVTNVSSILCKELEKFGYVVITTPTSDEVIISWDK